MMKETDIAAARELLEKVNILLLEKKPGRIILDTPEMFQVVDPGMRITTCNAVYRTNLDETRADEMISAAMKRFRVQGLPFRWTVSSSSLPKDLAARLTAKKPSSVLESSGFAATCDMVPDLPAPHVTVEYLRADNLQDYIQAAAESFAEIGPTPVNSLKALAQDSVARPNPDSLSFLARYRGRPAGIGRLRILRDGQRTAGYIAGGGVSPRFRHRGVARMVSQFSKELARRGIPLLLAHANEKNAAPLLRRLGFLEFDKQRLFVFEK